MNKHERVFGLKEHTNIMKRAAKSLVFVKRQKKKKLVNKQFKERIMLAITEVNGCQLCSFVHTKLSLSAGMELSEIRHILNGNLDQISDEELIAVLFAQHYAESHEQPTIESKQRLAETYGVDVALMIKGFCEVITFTNSMGITMNFLKNRLLFKRHKGSKFLTEVSIMFLSMFH